MNEAKVTGNRCQILKGLVSWGESFGFYQNDGKSWRDLGQGTHKVTFPF